MWKTIQINQQNIKKDTGNAVLIAMPHNSDYDGFEFWHPAKLIRSGNHSYAISLSYNDEFTFKLKKMGKGKYNSRDVIDEREISVADFEEAFGVMNENIVAPKDKNPFETHKPEQLEAEETQVLDELKDE